MQLLCLLLSFQYRRQKTWQVWNRQRWLEKWRRKERHHRSQRRRQWHLEKRRRPKKRRVMRPWKTQLEVPIIISDHGLCSQSSKVPYHQISRNLETISLHRVFTKSDVRRLIAYLTVAQSLLNIKYKSLPKYVSWLCIKINYIIVSWKK